MRIIIPTHQPFIRTAPMQSDKLFCRPHKKVCKKSRRLKKINWIPRVDFFVRNKTRRANSATQTMFLRKPVRPKSTLEFIPDFFRRVHPRMNLFDNDRSCFHFMSLLALVCPRAVRNSVRPALVRAGLCGKGRLNFLPVVSRFLSGLVLLRGR